MTPAVEELMKPVLRTVRVIWGSFVVATVFYVFLVQFLFRGQQPLPLPSSFVLAFSAVAFLSAAGALLLPRFYPAPALLHQIRQQDPSPDSLAVGSGAGGGDPARREAIRRLGSDDRRALQWGRHFATYTVVRCAFAESIVILGFVLSFITHRPELTLYFAVPSLLLLILVFPRIEPFMERWEHGR